MHGQIAFDALRRYDPTGTGDLRRRFRSDMDKRWARVKCLTRGAISDDLLGLSATLNRGTDPVRGFTTFIDTVMARVVLEGDGEWVSTYLDQAALRGRDRAYRQLPARSGGVFESNHGTVTASAASELKGIVQAVSQVTVRAVAQDLLAKNTARIARDIAERIDAVGKIRSRTLVEFSINQAFNGSTLDAYVALGLSRVGIEPEHRHFAFDYNRFHDPRTGRFASAQGAFSAEPLPEPPSDIPLKKREIIRRKLVSALRKTMRAGWRAVEHGRRLVVAMQLANVIQAEHKDWPPEKIVAHVVAAYTGFGRYSPHLSKIKWYWGVDAGFDPSEERDPHGRWVGSAVAQASTVDPYSETIAADPDYVYHATNIENAHDIAESGRLRVHGPSYGTEQSAWPDGSREKRSYFTRDPQIARSFYPAEGKMALLRFHRMVASFRRESTGDIYSRDPISAREAEIYVGGGRWRRLVGDAVLDAPRPTARGSGKGAGSRVSRKQTPSPYTIRRIEKAEAKVGELGVAEVVTAGDDLVCVNCQEIADSGPYDIDAARSLIPAHPHCRCAFVPYSDERFAEPESET